MRGAGSTRGMTMALGDLGDLARDQGDHARALAFYREALELVSGSPRSREVTDIVEAVGIVAVVVGPTERAVELLGAADALREWIGLRVRVAENQTAWDLAVTAARAALGAEAFAAAWAAGREVPPGQTVGAALELTAAVPSSLPRGPLSPRELDVLRLLVAGLPDRAIAAELYLSARTVENHVSRIFAKLGVRTRTAAVRAAIAAGYVAVNPPPDA
jgi:DNA-binding CsgD family transcriptional regulator